MMSQNDDLLLCFHIYKDKNYKTNSLCKGIIWVVDEIQLKGEAYFPIDCGDFVCSLIKSPSAFLFITYFWVL